MNRSKQLSREIYVWAIVGAAFVVVLGTLFGVVTVNRVSDSQPADRAEKQQPSEPSTKKTTIANVAQQAIAVPAVDPVKAEIESWIHDNISPDIKVIWVKRCEYRGASAYLVRYYRFLYTNAVFVRSGESWSIDTDGESEATNIREF